MNQSITVLAMDWPRYPSVTKTGRVSKSKRAGKLLPWLSINAVKRMAGGEHHAFIGMWRESAREKFSELVQQGRRADRPPYYLDVLLIRPRACHMDVLGIAEGCKPIVDGAVLAGVLPDDSARYVSGILRAETVKGARPGIVIVLVPVSEAPGWLAARYGSRPGTSPTASPGGLAGTPASSSLKAGGGSTKTPIGHRLQEWKA